MSDDAGVVVEKDDRRLELLAAVILGVAGVLTAFVAYKAALTDGDALKGYTQSARTTADANGYFNEAFSTFTSDQSLFFEYQVLVEQGEADLAFTLRDRFFSEELEAGTAAWEQIEAGAPGEPPTPLDTEEYTIPAQAEAIALTEQAADEFAEAQGFDDAGDKFELAAVFLAVSLFLAGIATIFRVRTVQIAVLVMSVVAIVPGVIAMLQGQSAL
jgi:hypothetical protein